MSQTDATRLWTPGVYDRISRYYDFFSDTVFRTPKHGRERAGAWFGDVPRDYRGLFRELGYEPELESLGGFGSYQYLSVTRS